MKRFFIYGFVVFLILACLVGLKPYCFFKSKADFGDLLPADISNGLLTARIQNEKKGSLGPKKSSKRKLQFVLEAHGKNVKVYEDWNSWGFFARSFTAVEKTDPKIEYEISRQCGAWDHNFPSMVKIIVGQPLVTDIDFCDRTWVCDPKPSPRKDHCLILQGHFDLGKKRGRDLVDKFDLGVWGNSWLGHLDTNKIEVIISKEMAQCLNKPNPW